jgi:transposase
LQREDAGQREHDLREVFNGLRYIVKAGAPWRWMPNDLPPWAAVHQQTQRWLAAGCFEALVDDLRAVLRLAVGRKAGPHRRDHRQPDVAFDARERRALRL